MKRILLLAWRNLWRNRRRTLITVASVFFGVLLSTVMSSMQEGTYSKMIDNIVRLYSGYIQVHHEDYLENKTINNIFEPPDSLMRIINDVVEITSMAPRLESFALASSETITRGSAVIGIDPAGENAITEISKWIAKGEYLKPNDNSALVGSELAKYLELEVNDTLVLIGQGYHGVSAAGKYPIKGILDFPNPELNKQSVYLDLRACQELYGTGAMVTSVVLMVEDYNHLPIALGKLRPRIGSPYSVMTWSEMQPGIVQMIEADRAGSVIMKAILYMLVAFGIFGTIMMMVAERKREMGVMVAIGMQKFRLSMILFFETVLIGLVGVFAGFCGSIPLIAYFFKYPIRYSGDAAETMIEMGYEPLMYFSWTPAVFYKQVFVVFIITAVIAVYPVARAGMLKVSQALRA